MRPRRDSTTSAALRSAPMQTPLLIETADNVRTLTLNRPEARNALNMDLLNLLTVELCDADADDTVDVIVLTGTDPAFCAGLDLKGLSSFARVPADAGHTTPERSKPERKVGAPTNPWLALRSMTKPVIGAVNGVAVTGGFELALGCDFLIASDKAAFADTHARVKVMPDGGLTGLLPQSIGLRRAKEMSLTSKFLDAEEALRVGLVNHVVPHDQLMESTLELAAKIIKNDQAAVRNLKRIYDEGSRMTLAECFAMEHREHVAWGFPG